MSHHPLDVGLRLLLGHIDLENACGLRMEFMRSEREDIVDSTL